MIITDQSLMMNISNSNQIVFGKRNSIRQHTDSINNNNSSGTGNIANIKQ